MSGDNTGAARYAGRRIVDDGKTTYTHGQGATTVTVAARGEMLGAGERFSLVARRELDGTSRAMVDVRSGLDYVRVRVETSELLRMSSAVAALLEGPGAAGVEVDGTLTELQLQMRGQGYAEHVLEDLAAEEWPSLASEMFAKRVEKFLSVAFQVGYEAGRREG